MKYPNTYHVLNEARRITDDAELDILEIRKYLGVPLSNDIRRWMAEQPTSKRLIIDFHGIRAISASVAEELGPLLMQAIQQLPTLEQKYPIFRLDKFEHAYTFGVAFVNLNWTGLAIVDDEIESSNLVTQISEKCSEKIVILGQLSKQMEQILAFADRCVERDKLLTSETLTELEFMADVTLAARSKRLSELYARRLLAFRENPRNPKERLFVPVWHLS